MILQETYTLSNGILMPKLGLGTWLLNDDQAEQATIDAIKIGYKLIDTAQAYRNEEGVGKGLKKSGISRDEIFITTKVEAEHKDYESAKRSIDESLEKLQLDYVDQVIIHSPQPWKEFRKDNHYYKENIEVWKALEDTYNEGKAKSIGLSNFRIDDVKNILEHADTKPMVNQILAHISNTPFDLIKFCKENNILVEAYSPIAHGAILNNEEIMAVAAKYGVSVAQLCLKYDLELGMVVLPKTANPLHMKQNSELDFEITEADMKLLENIKHIEDYGEDTHFPVFREEL